MGWQYGRPHSKGRPHRRDLGVFSLSVEQIRNRGPYLLGACGAGYGEDFWDESWQRIGVEGGMMGETYRIDQAKEMLARAVLKADKNRWATERTASAERLFEAVVEAGKAAGFKVSEQGYLLLNGVQFVMLHDETGIWVTSYRGKQQLKTEKVKLEYNAIRGIFEAEMDDHYTHPTPGEAHRRADAVAVMALVISRLMEG